MITSDLQRAAINDQRTLLVVYFALTPMPVFSTQTLPNGKHPGQFLGALGPGHSPCAASRSRPATARLHVHS